MNAVERRGNARRAFARTALGVSDFSIEPASADASFRSYWRVSSTSAATCILMDAPPGKEDIGAWLDIGERLHAAGLHTPQVLAVDRARGFVLMEDLGTRTYLPELDESSVDRLYQDALDALLRMQTQVDDATLPPYDRALLVNELELMPEWFLGRHLGFTPSCDEWDVMEAAFTFLIQAALEQPRRFVHRDFHSRNLLVVDTSKPAATAPGVATSTIVVSELANPGIIDFQDAVTGPITYDLVSLLRDCYIEWEAERVDGWMEGYHARLRAADAIGSDVDAATFRRWFDLTGLQRHLKVLGIFCRLWYRDGKAQYLADLPLVWRHVITVARHYPPLHDFAGLLERARGERELTQPRAEVAA